MAVECCPVNYVYVDAAGNYDDIGFGTGTIVNQYGVAGCARLVVQPNGSFIIVGPLLDPFECPCCAVGYEYSSYKAICINENNPQQTAPTIPCIPCICPDDPVPRVCDTPDRGLERSMDFTDGKLCDDCEVDENYGPSGRITCFIPQQDLDPIIAGFKLRNKNFM